MSKPHYVLYVLDKLLPPRIRIVKLSDIYYKYNRFTILFFHPAFFILYKLINRMPNWRLTRFLNTLVFRVSHRLFRVAKTVILPKKAPSY